MKQKFVYIIFFLFSSVSYSQEQGSFSIQSVNTELNDGVLILDANIDLNLTDRAIDAIYSGINLSFYVDIEMNRYRRFWFNESIATLRQEYDLAYNEITERFTVINLNSTEVSTFASLESALNFLGRISRLPILDASLIDQSTNHFIELRSGMVIDSDSRFDRIINILRRDENIESDWFEWQVN